METVGSLVDKLITVSNKMFYNQEFLYEIRRMSLDEFKNIYFNAEKIEELYNKLKLACDLNVQRNDLITEIDETITKEVNNTISGDTNYIIKQYKTY